MTRVEPFSLSDDVVTLVPPVEADVDVITRLCQDPAVHEWTTLPSPYTRADALTFVTQGVARDWAEDSAWTWGVRTDGQLRGMIGISAQPVRSGEIGYWLGAGARGRGLVHRSLRLVLDRAFDPAGLDLDRVEWCCYAGNVASWRAVWRVGFRFEGVVRGGRVQRQHRRDTWLGTLLRADPREPVAPWPAGAPVDPTAPTGAPVPR